MSGEIKRYGDWVPGKGKLMVGDKDLVVKELVGGKRDAVADLVSDGLDILEIAKPLMEAYKRRGKAVSAVIKDAVALSKEAPSGDELDRLVNEKLKEEEDNTDTMIELVSKLEGKFRAMLQGQITVLGCVILDVEENRKVVLGDQKDEITDHPKYGFEHSAKMFKWVSGNLSLHQEANLLDAFLDVNKFMEMAKKYMALVLPQIAGAAGAIAEASAATH